MTTCSISNGHDWIEDCPRSPAQRAARSPRWRHLSDDRLIAYCKAGNGPAWDALLDRYQQYLFRYAWSLCHNRADAEDITAQTLFRIYERLDTFREDSSFAAWITRIAHNLFLDTTLRSRHSPTLSLDDPPQFEDGSISGYELADPGPTPEAHCLDLAAVERIGCDLQHLPAYLRTTLTMHLKGYSYEQTAATQGISIGTVKSRIWRARSMLRKRLAS
ncbi:MAG TPA: RNA polymerase sigma factor [Chthonomonadaceae bacterium]|nr:RNA polymerase sigma factor [Chthonomonadaceae bacterium]